MGYLFRYLLVCSKPPLHRDHGRYHADQISKNVHWSGSNCLLYLLLSVQWLSDKISKVLLLLSRILNVYLCNSIFSWKSTECLKGNIKLVTHIHLLFENNHIKKTAQKFLWKLFCLFVSSNFILFFTLQYYICFTIHWHF